MSGYFSNLLTTTSSKYNSLRSLIPSNSETDGDTEDDTHLCRVLRAYYVEKGRPFPAWLPPDPKAPPPVAAVTLTPYPPVGAGYGGMGAQQGGAATSRLGSLWDQQPQQAPLSQPQSLRSGRGQASQVLRAGGSDPYNRNNMGMNKTPEPPAVQARPLPSQRAGSVQQGLGNTGTPPGSAGSGSAQERLKNKLWGAARQTSPVPNSAQQPPAPTQAPAVSARNPYARADSGGSGRYDDRSGGGGYERSGDRPFMAATSPWASNVDEFSGGGYGGGGGYSGYSEPAAAPASTSRRVGLPSGPRGGGLPGGPRPVR